MRTRKWRVGIACLLAVAAYSLVAPNMAEVARGASAPLATTHHYQVEWGGTHVGFHSAEGLGSTVEVLEYRDGNSASQDPRKLPGKVTHHNLILRNPASQMGEMWQWYKTSLNGQAERRDLVVSILNTNHEPVITYKLRNAWPCAWRCPKLFGGGKQIALEEVEIAYESMVREGADG